MGIPVDELTQRLGGNHVAFYKASYELHPPVGDLLDLLTAVTCAIGCRGNVSDFMPKRHEDDAEPEDEAQAFADRMGSLAAMQSQAGKVVRERA
jgi:hypothetical protein